MRTNRTLRLSLALLTVSTLIGCANLEAVREFTSNSAKLTGYTEVSDRFVSSPARIQAQIPDDPRFDPDQANTKRLAAEIALAKDSLFKLHSVTTGYMEALAQLAGEDAFSLSPQIDQVTGALVAAPSFGLNAEHVQAFGSIASKVTSWLLAAKQAKEVKTMVETHGAAMDKLLEGMELVASAMKVQLDNERGQLRTYEDVRLSSYLVQVGGELPPPSEMADAERIRYEPTQRSLDNRRKAMLVWARRSYVDIEQEQNNAVSSAIAAIEGIKVVRKGHDDMRRNIDRLTSAQLTALLKKAASDLKSIRQNLNTL